MKWLCTNVDLLGRVKPRSFSIRKWDFLGRQRAPEHSQFEGDWVFPDPELFFLAKSWCFPVEEFPLVQFSVPGLGVRSSLVGAGFVPGFDIWSSTTLSGVRFVPGFGVWPSPALSGGGFVLGFGVQPSLVELGLSLGLVPC